MTKPAIIPVEQWLPLFHHFTDRQILDPNYAVSRIRDGWHCKLCDAAIRGEKPDDHLARHAAQARVKRQRASNLKRGRLAKAA